MNLQYEEALELLLREIRPVGGTEVLPLLEADGRVLAEDIVALFDQPPFPRSPLDGYALLSADTRGADKDHPVTLRVIAEEMAGQQTDAEVQPGTAVRIMTGAPIPAGADCVIKQEATDYGEETVAIYDELTSGQNICQRGEDYQAGTELLLRGDVLGPAGIGVIAGTGRATVRVYQRPRVMVLSTGDELLQPGEPLRGGGIYDANLPLLQSNLKRWGARIVCAQNSGDDPHYAADIIRAHADDVDLVVTTGGVSVGKKDIMHDVYRILDVRRLFWKVAIKPGMPTLAGIYGDTPILSLSGNPFGVVVTAELFLKAIMGRLTGTGESTLLWDTAVVDTPFRRATALRRFVRARYEGGHVRVTDDRSANGTLRTVCHSNCLIDIPAGHGPLEEGDTVQVLML